MFSFKWTISDAEQILIKMSQSLSSSCFPGNKMADNFYLSAQWFRDTAEKIQPAKLSVTLKFSHQRKLCVSNLHFLIVDCCSKKIVKGKDRSLPATYNSSTLEEAITIPENEPLENFLHNGALTIQVTGTIIDTSPKQSVIHSSVIPEHGFSEKINRMFQDGLFTDLTIVVGEKTFKVHKVVLGSQSDVFKRMLESDMKEKNEAVVEIADIAPAVMEDFLAYLYTGSPPNIKNFAKELLLVADKYDIMRLRLLCENELKMGLTVETVTSVLLLADKLQQESGSSLLEACINFIKQHSAAVRQSEEWANNVSDLSKNDLESILSV